MVAVVAVVVAGVVGVVVVGVVVAVVVVVVTGVARWRTEMRKIVETVEGEGLDKLLGEVVTLFCLNYIYTGKLVGVNDTCVLLEQPSIVYETGPFDNPAWKDAQRLPHALYVMRGAIESFGVVK